MFDLWSNKAFAALPEATKPLPGDPGEKRKEEPRAAR